MKNENESGFTKIYSHFITPFPPMPPFPFLYQKKILPFVCVLITLPCFLFGQNSPFHHRIRSRSGLKLSHMMGEILLYEGPKKLGVCVIVVVLVSPFPSLVVREVLWHFLRQGERQPETRSTPFYCERV